MLARMFVLGAALLTPGAVCADEAAETFRALLVQYRCPVVDRLEQIYQAAGTADPQDPFLIIELAARPQDYVQCVFDSATRMLCEASSGFFLNPPDVQRTYRLPPDAIAALGHLGFSTDDSAGNFRIWFDISQPTNFNRIADFMLKALHDGYGARAETDLHFSAPLASHTSSQCIPVS